VGDGSQSIGTAVSGDFVGGSVMLPPKFFNKECFEFEVFQALPRSGYIQRHGLFLFLL
jgi:hypothetical protein